MKATIDLQPFSVPNFVAEKLTRGSRQEGMQWSAKLAIEDVSAETLSDLCDQFRKDLFEKAGKRDPKEQEQ